MKFFDNLCETVVRVLGLSAFTPWGEPSASQQPLAGGRPPPGKPLPLPEGPVFRLPNAQIECDYRAMRGYKYVGGSQSDKHVGSWLEPPPRTSSPAYNIYTDYEVEAPTGITRYYELDLVNGTAIGHEINADGKIQYQSKIFNTSYPGPWIQACWGDTLEITVRNSLQTNGTTIHWHGVRQLNTWDMDGVNAVTQCAIAPKDSMRYTFKALQYGTSWYHSHYSLQYADGALGPLTIFGPSTAHYDDALDPWMVTDWAHESAFTSYYHELHAPPVPQMDTILLNGTGTFNCTSWAKKGPAGEPCPKTPGIFEAVFKKGNKYLVRLINTSTATTFVFSVDKHLMKVIGADFVPIRPYYTEAVFVGIGQRYHVIIEANPADELTPIEDQNYWIRANTADGCAPAINYPNTTVGVIRYSGSSKKTPTTPPYLFDQTCRDEPYQSLVPVVPRIAGKASNDFKNADDYLVGFWNGDKNTIPNNNLTRWSLTEHTMYLNMSEPSIDHITDKKFPPEMALIFEDYTENDWVYLLIEGTNSTVGQKGKNFVPTVHPIHLHGHDFLLLAQQYKHFNATTDPYDPTIFNYINPPRRDVALLPTGGYIVIAFKTDNPGIWVAHCHIAWHASSGLALQMFERQGDVIKQASLPGWKDQTDRVCGNWRTWLDDPKNWYNSVEFQEDSGI